MPYTVTDIAEASTAINDLDARVVALVAAVAALDARLDTAEALLVTHTGQIAALVAADTALDGRVDVLEGVPRGASMAFMKRFTRVR